ncbi:hypothetical protein BSKO_00878 [Bryopsis sp. KO-2023]|nr:hypothetical protein BSKO_00878 [Bryopsis sp. KO-2023]
MIAKLTYKLKAKQVAVDGDAQCGKLKGIAAEFSGLPEDQLKLLYRGKLLADEGSLSDAGFKDGAKIHILETEAYQRSQAMASDAAKKLRDAQAAAEDPVKRTLRKIQEEVGDFEKKVETGLKEGFGSTNPRGIVHLLTQKLEVLDGLEVSGETRELRRSVIKYINQLCDRVEAALQSGQVGG